MTRHGRASSSSIPTIIPSPETSNPATTESTFTEVSGPVASGSNQPTNEGRPATETTFVGEVVRQIEALIESFRLGKTRKSQTIYKIGQLIESEPRGNDELKSETLDRYAATLDGIEALAAQSNQHGNEITSTLLGKRKEESEKRGRGHEELNRSNVNPRPVNVDDFLGEISKENELDSAENVNGVGSGDDNDADSDNEPEEQGHGRSNKKQRIYESQMPWFSKEQRFRQSNANLSCNKTRTILDLFQRDTATVKRWIRCASSAPAAFPSSEWDALIKGDSVDIDTVFSSLHHIHSIEESVGRVGATEIQFGRPKPAARVETSGQWTAAFNLIVKATTFLFPHRREELQQYGDYIEELFSAKSLSTHPKLFKYDEAIRYKVGQGQNILLTDRGAFTRYYEAIVAPDGIGFEETSGGDKGNKKKGGKSGEKSDICHRFNGANGCSNAADKCKYKHICKKCKQRGHGKMDCKVVETV
jgi:hypothetical protein